jgi:hypothetical protein
VGGALKIPIGSHHQIYTVLTPILFTTPRLHLRLLMTHVTFSNLDRYIFAFTVITDFYAAVSLIKQEIDDQSGAAFAAD